MDKKILNKIKSDQDGLLNILSDIVANDMLLEIAKADNDYDVDLHLKALTTIRDENNPGLMDWHPREVLSLFQWSEPNDSNSKPGTDGTSGHIMRAFSCTVLLRAAIEPENEGFSEFDGENQTLAQLLVSVSVLGEIYEKSVLPFIAWSLDTITDENEEHPFFILALLYLALKIKADLSAKDIDSIVTSLVLEEEKLRINRNISLTDKNYYWLLGLTYFIGKHYIWQAIGVELITLAKNIPDPQVQERVIDIGHRLAQKIVPRITGFE